MSEHSAEVITTINFVSKSKYQVIGTLLLHGTAHYFNS